MNRNATFRLKMRGNALLVGFPVSHMGHMGVDISDVTMGYSSEELSRSSRTGRRCTHLNRLADRSYPALIKAANRDWHEETRKLTSVWNAHLNSVEQYLKQTSRFKG